MASLQQRLVKPGGRRVKQARYYWLRLAESVAAVFYGRVNADNGWQFAWNYGGGADLVLQRHFALRLDLRDYITGQPTVITGTGHNITRMGGTSHNIVPSAGLVFRFK